MSDLPPTLPKVLGTQEVAALLGVHRVTVLRWRREGTMPSPDAELAAGPVWLGSTIERWVNEREGA